MLGCNTKELLVHGKRLVAEDLSSGTPLDPELLGICDRILVMRRGRLAGEIPDAGRATQEEIMALAV